MCWGLETPKGCTLGPARTMIRIIAVPQGGHCRNCGSPLQGQEGFLEEVPPLVLKDEQELTREKVVRACQKEGRAWVKIWR